MDSVKIIHIGDVDDHFCNVIQRGPGIGQNLRQIFEDMAGLGLDVVGRKRAPILGAAGQPGQVNDVAAGTLKSSDR
ncbi:MAG: hypothetical protein VW169_05205, partial [Rhodospirillaceae bacterium]